MIDIMTSDPSVSAIKTWLFLSAFLVLIMVAIGGFTRLSNAGLSVVEWKPVTGTIPPITSSDWQAEFDKYQTSPEYKKINSDINLGQFKYIYAIEYIHRLMGRFTVLFYLVPLIYWVYTRRITQNISSFLTIAGLFFAQGLMGWLMVKSGLIDDPHVSHFRLSAHLMLAVITFSMILWQFFRYAVPSSTGKIRCSKNEYISAVILLALLFMQLALGGFVAGLNAGLIYNEFPFMGASFVPMEITSFSMDSLSDAVHVQFMHRIGGYIVFLGAISYALYISHCKKAQLTAFFIGFMASLQVVLGILTLIWHVPLIFALLHQLAAVILLGSILWAFYYNMYKL